MNTTTIIAASYTRSLSQTTASFQYNNLQKHTQQSKQIYIHINFHCTS